MRLIVITTNNRASPRSRQKGDDYMVNVASSRNGVGAGDWIRIDGFFESVIDRITASEGGHRVSTLGAITLGRKSNV